MLFQDDLQMNIFLTSLMLLFQDKLQMADISLISFMLLPMNVYLTFLVLLFHDDLQILFINFTV